MKILCIGDTHFRDNLPYADYITDRRETEKKEILDFIIKSSEDCDHIVFLGDFFHSKNNSSEVNRMGIEFIERFGNKHIYIISGNHCKKGDGKTSIDFLSEIRDKNWKIFTTPQTIYIGNLKTSFLPYMLNSQLGVENSKEGALKIMTDLPSGDILFTHHAISGTSFGGIKAEELQEIVLPQNELEKKYSLIIGGHIHTPQAYGKILITGSLFTSEVGEIEKFIWKIDENLKIEKIKVPSREIHKLENPSKQQIEKIPKNAIVKIIITDRQIDIEEVKDIASRFDASLLIENYPNERKKIHIEQGAFDFEIESLLKLYAESKNISLEKLIKGYELVK